MEQFVYTRKEGEIAYKDTFSLNKVIRSRELEDGTRLVILDDIHERVHAIPVTNKKNEVIRTENKRMVVQSEILLDKDDAMRFIKRFLHE